MKEKLPHAQASLILGIFSIVTCCCYGLPGVILGVIGLLQANKAIAIHNENPDNFDGLGNANTGKIMSIIGLVLGALTILSMLYAISRPEFMEEFNKAMEEFKQN